MAKAGDQGGAADGGRSVRRRSLRRWLVDALSHLFDGLYWLWRPLRRLFQLFWYCRIPALAVGVCGIVLLINDQAQDALTQLPFPDVPALGFHGALWLLAFSAWFMARIRLDLELARMMAEHRAAKAASGCAKPPSRFLVFWVPRAIGFAIFLFAVVALLKAVRPDTPNGLGFIAAVVAAEGALFLALVWGRVWMLTQLKRLGLLPRFIAIPARSFDDAEPPPGSGPTRRMFTTTRVVMGAMLGLSLTMALATGLFPVRTAELFNPLAMAMFGAAAIAFFASVLAYVGDVKRVPIIGTIVLLSMVTTLFSNPADRIGPADGGEPRRRLADPLGRPKLLQAFNDWLAVRGYSPADCRSGGFRQPILFVSAAGGGSRAGYWTTLVLLQLSQDPAFRDALFSVSGVSGGSIGAVVFAGLDGTTMPIQEKLEAARSFFSHDFLTPVIGAAVFSDLARRFAFPFLPFTDRAGAIEQALAAAWRDVAPDASHSDWNGPFLALWRGSRGRATPALFLNGTVVETGSRFIASNIAFGIRPPHSYEAGVPVFPDAIDGLLEMGVDPGLARAVSLSYRFPYVLPTAEIMGQGKILAHVVDGGYFENYGATTSFDLLRSLAGSGLPCLHPVVVQISSDPALGSKSFTDPQPLGDPMRWATEIRAPLATMLATRSARGIYAATHLHEIMHHEDFFHFRLCASAGVAPLGFVLSKSAVAVIQATWSAGSSGGDDCTNAATADGLQRRLVRIPTLIGAGVP